MKVKELLLFYGDLKNGKDLSKKADYWLEIFGLADYTNKKVETLSKGMTQKVQFIATVISEPELLILDEPFTGLDPVNADVIKSAVLDLQKNGATVVFSTHDMNVAEKMCDFIFMIYKGEKVLDGTLHEIQDQYGTDRLRIRAENGSRDYSAIPGVEGIDDFGQTQELILNAGVNSQDVIKQVLEISPVRSFEVARPSLHDIFVRIAGPEAGGEEDVN
jgi:ABC-2 type transport system ATP-binding protein